MRAKRKNVMICHSTKEMERKADALIEKGFHVEREMGVQSVPTMYLPIYKVMYWK